MSFQLSSERAYENLEYLGVAIQHVQDNQLHVGVLYRDYDNKVMFCHLPWHDKLVNEIPQDGYYWEVCIWVGNLDEENIITLTALINNIARGTRKIPYGFLYRDTAFDPSGRFLGFHAKGMGLTCATFVVAAFESAGFQILKAKTWKHRRSDVNWQQKLLRLMRSSGVDAEHIREVQKTIGSLRFRPEEVAAAATAPAPPIDYSQARKEGRAIFNLVAADNQPSSAA